MTNNHFQRISSHHNNLTRILDNLKEGILAHDLDRRIIFFNREAEKITGYRREDVLGKTCEEAFGAPLCGGKCQFYVGDDASEDAAEYTTNIITKNGDTRRVEMAPTVMFDDDGHPQGVLTSMRDVTDYLQLQIQARKLTSFAGIIGQDARMLQVFEQIRDVSAYDFPVHIGGETGTGKELVAHAIHNESSRGGGPFVPINCGALPEGLIASELFGHVKGSFTGAHRDKMGRFELADGGTIFLDEVTELPRPIQATLLRFLQENSFERVGDEKTISVDVRIISATNKELKTEVNQNRFRDDLFYRLNVIPVHLPPLRERKTDIPLLIEHFLHETEKQYGRHPHQVVQEAMALLMDYQWPGNVRELQNAVQFAMVRAKGRFIRPDDLPLEVRAGCPPAPSAPVTHHRKIRLSEETVVSAMEKTGGNKARAARILGVGRATLYRFLTAHPGLLS
ncbi:MAG: sigma-54-dependent Fis family transcriptional regulator [Deltaproteobacteria bacterium]|nr:MAG: sigma-54-dependent Fis family transcriptional regulator [Deltaproteobacteria bacterium]